VKLSAVIFDMDGILIDSENLWQQGEKELFAGMGHELGPELLTETRGLVTGEMVDHWVERFGIASVNREELIEVYDRRMVELMRTRVPLMEGAIGALEFFRDLGLPLALASCSTRMHIDATLERHGLHGYFEQVVSAADGMPGKPHPEIYLHTARMLGFDPVDCLALEDSFFGVISAKAARMRVLAMPDPAEYAQKRFHAADLKIRSLTEINQHLYHKILAL
jgi:sugar-phosphatase